MTANVEIKLPNLTPSYVTRPHSDPVAHVDLAAWMAAGCVFWGRSDGVNLTPAAGIIEMNDRRTASATVLRQASTTVNTPAPVAITQKSDYGYLGGGKTLGWEAGAGSIADRQFMDLTADVLPQAGAMAVYMIVHPYTAVVDLFGTGDSTSGMSATIVNGQLRFARNFALTVVLDTGLSSSLRNMPLVVGCITQPDGHLAIRLLKGGDTAWSQAVSASTSAANITKRPRFGRIYDGVSSGSNNFFGRSDDIICWSGDIAAKQAEVENYLAVRAAIK